MLSVLRYFQKSSPYIIFSIFFIVATFHGNSQSSTPFKEVAKNSPYRNHTIKRVIPNKELKLSSYYSPKEKRKDGSIGKAWKKVSTYFPKKFYYSSESTYFMTHQFTSGV